MSGRFKEHIAEPAGIVALWAQFRKSRAQDASEVSEQPLVTDVAPVTAPEDVTPRPSRE